MTPASKWHRTRAGSRPRRSSVSPLLSKESAMVIHRCLRLGPLRNLSWSGWSQPQRAFTPDVQRQIARAARRLGATRAIRSTSSRNRRGTTNSPSAPSRRPVTQPHRRAVSERPVSPPNGRCRFTRGPASSARPQAHCWCGRPGKATNWLLDAPTPPVRGGEGGGPQARDLSLVACSKQVGDRAAAL